MNSEGPHPSVGDIIFHVLFVLAYGMQPGSRRHREVLGADRIKHVEVQEAMSVSRCECFRDSYFVKYDRN